MSFVRTLLLALVGGAFAGAGMIVAACDSSGTLVPVEAGGDVRTFDVVTFDGPTLFEASTLEGGPAEAGDAGEAGGGDASLFGFVDFRQHEIAGGDFVGAFYGSQLHAAPGCTSSATDGGACVVTTCAANVASDAGAVALVTAGALTVTGGAFGDAGIAIGPDSLGSYLYNTTGPMFVAGDTLTVAAAGATVPAFPAQTLTTPGPITLTAPVADGGTMTIPSASDLTVTWTGGTTGNRVVVDLAAFFTSGASAGTVCAWDATAGTGTIPAAQLAPLASGTPQPNRSTVLWYQRTQATVAAGKWNVVVSAYINGGSLAAFQ